MIYLIVIVFIVVSGLTTLVLITLCVSGGLDDERAGRDEYRVPMPVTGKERKP